MAAPLILHWSQRLAAVSGACSVAMGAYGAHGLKPADPYFAEVFKRANHYHMIHSLFLLAAPLARCGGRACGVSGLHDGCALDHITV